MIAELGATAARLPVRRRDEALARASRSAGRTSSRSRPATTGDFDERGADRPRRARPARREAVEPGQRRAGRGGRGNAELAQVCIGSSVNSSYEDLALVGAVLRGSEISEKLISATATPGLSSDPRPDHAVGRRTRPAVGRRADARACVRALRRHGPGAALGRELAAHVQPELPRAEAGRPTTRSICARPRSPRPRC